MPVINVIRKKPAARASDSRLEMVIVKRWLDAAKAISAGNRNSLIASAAIICIPLGTEVITEAKALKLAVRLPTEGLPVLLRGFFQGRPMTPHCLIDRQRSSCARGRE